MLTDPQKFQADFNLHMVPAAVGLPVPLAAAAAIFDADPTDLAAYRQEAAAAVRETAQRLLEQPELAQVLDRWPPDGARVMFVGDSITTYLYSYSRILPAMLDLHRPGHGVTFFNVAQSGYTTSNAYERTFTQFLDEQPDWVFIKLGANDTKQFGNPEGRTLVPLDAYTTNLSGIVAAFKTYTPGRVVLLAPAPVVDTVTNTLPDFVAKRLTWDNRVIRQFAAAAATVAAQHDSHFINLFDVFGPAPDPSDYVPDGLHPGPAGHVKIVTRILQAMGEIA